MPLLDPKFNVETKLGTSLTGPSGGRPFSVWPGKEATLGAASFHVPCSWDGGYTGGIIRPILVQAYHPSSLAQAIHVIYDREPGR